MVIKLNPQPTVLCQGDNITYSGRREDSDGGVEDGYARLAAELIRATHARAAASIRPGPQAGSRSDTACLPRRGPTSSPSPETHHSGRRGAARPPDMEVPPCT
jgi:hypothetical protein